MATTPFEELLGKLNEENIWYNYFEKRWDWKELKNEKEGTAHLVTKIIMLCDSDFEGENFYSLVTETRIEEGSIFDVNPNWRVKKFFIKLIPSVIEEQNIQIIGLPKTTLANKNSTFSSSFETSEDVSNFFNPTVVLNVAKTWSEEHLSTTVEGKIDTKNHEASWLYSFHSKEISRGTKEMKQIVMFRSKKKIDFFRIQTQIQVPKKCNNNMRSQIGSGDWVILTGPSLEEREQLNITVFGSINAGKPFFLNDLITFASNSKKSVRMLDERSSKESLTQHLQVYEMQIPFSILDLKVIDTTGLALDASNEEKIRKILTGLPSETNLYEEDSWKNAPQDSSNQVELPVLVLDVSNLLKGRNQSLASYFWSWLGYPPSPIQHDLNLTAIDSIIELYRLIHILISKVLNAEEFPFVILSYLIGYLKKKLI